MAYSKPAEDYTDFLKQHGVVSSMSRKGNPYDNAACQSLMKTPKYEEVYRQEYRDLTEVLLLLVNSSNRTYNQKRLHSVLGYRPPVEFEEVQIKCRIKVRGRPRTRFLRHSGIYRPDVSFLLINPERVRLSVGRPRSQVIGRDGRCTPCPSFAMSSGRLFLDRDGRHQSPSPLHRHPQHKAIPGSNETNYHRVVTSALTGCLSQGDPHPTPHTSMSCC